MKASKPDSVQIINSLGTDYGGLAGGERATMSSEALQFRGALVQRKCNCGKSSCSTCQEKDRRILRDSIGNAPAPTHVEQAPPDVGAALSQSGSLLPDSVQDYMGSRLNFDFSEVRVHTGSIAAASADALNANAFTVGRDVVFGKNQFSPASSGGLSLLAHELTHVVQQARGNAQVHSDTQSLEREADRTAASVAQGANSVAQITGKGPSGIARQEKSSEGKSSSALQVNSSEGSIQVFANGLQVFSFEYDSSKGAAHVSRFKTPHGDEVVNVQIPAGARKGFSRTGLGEAPAGFSVNCYIPEGNEASEFTSSCSVTKLAPKNQQKPPAPRPKPPQVKPKKEEAPEKKEEPKRSHPMMPDVSVETIINEHSGVFDLNENMLGETLLNYALSGDIAKVNATLDALGSTDRDDIAYRFLTHASDEELRELGQTEEGRTLLTRLLDEMSSGWQGDDEKVQGERLQRARAQNIDPQEFADAPQKAMVLPFSGVGFTKLSSASISAHMLPNGKLWVRSHMKAEHFQHAKNLKSNNIFIRGMEIDPDEVIGINMLDEGGQTVYVPALKLLELSNQETATLGFMGGEAVLAGLTLGTGSGAVTTARTGAGWAAKGMSALKWADRGATALAAADTLIRDHRGLIIKHFGKGGQDFLNRWQAVQSIISIYGIGRGTVAIGQALNSLRKSHKHWKNMQSSMKNLSAEDKEALEKLIDQAEASIDHLESAHLHGVSSKAPRGVNEETVKMLAKKPELMNALAKHPAAASALTLCNSPCIPSFAKPKQIARIQKLMKSGSGRGAMSMQRLREYLHSAKSEGELTGLINDWETAVKSRGKPGSAAAAATSLDKFPDVDLREAGRQSISGKKAVSVNQSGTLVGRNTKTSWSRSKATAQHRTDVSAAIHSDKNHPLRFLLNKQNRLKNTTKKGMNKFTWHEDPTLVESGHKVSSRAVGPGEEEILVLQSAHKNRLLAAKVENRRGGYVVDDEPFLDIGGVAVDVDLALDWLDAGLITAETFEKAKLIRL